MHNGHIHRVYFVTYLTTQTASLQPHEGISFCTFNASAQRRPCNGGAAAMKRASGGRRPRIDAPCYVLLEMAVNAPATTSYAQIHQQVSLLLAHKVWIF